MRQLNSPVTTPPPLSDNIFLVSGAKQSNHKWGILYQSIVRKAAFLLAFPVAEFLSLRVLLHSFLGLRIGWPFGVDFDFLIPIPAAFILYVWALEKGSPRQPAQFQLSPVYSAINICFVGLLLFASTFFVKNSVWFYAFWWGSALGVASSSFLVFASPSYFLKNRNRLAFLPCGFLAFSIVLAKSIPDDIWLTFAHLTGNLSCTVLRNSIFPDLACRIGPYEGQTAILLFHKYFSAVIGKGCGGIDALLMLTNLLVLLWVVAPGPKKFNTFFLLFGFGLLWMFLTNLTRIVSLFCLGALLNSLNSKAVSAELVVNLFHLHAGWILYLISLTAFLTLATNIQNLRSVNKSLAWLGKTRNFIGLGLIILTLSFSGVAYAAACGESCNDPSDCSSGCSVCIGVCVTCEELGDQNACQDASSGASTACVWEGSSCLPEFSKTLRPFLMLFFFVGLFNRRRKRMQALTFH